MPVESEGPSGGPTVRRDIDTARRIVHRATRRALVLGIVALVLGIVAIVGPADVHRSVFEWSAARDRLDVPLVLSASRPQTIDIQLPCALVRQNPAANGVAPLFATTQPADQLPVAFDGGHAGLAVVGDGRKLQAFVGTTSVVSVPIGPASCDGTLHFDSRTGILRLGVGAASAQVRLSADRQPIVSGLHAAPDAAGTALSVRIVTQPTASSPSPVQWLAIVGGLACVLGAVLLLLRRPREGDGARVPRRWLPTPLVTGGDAVVAAVAVLSTALNPAVYDDGWVLATVRGFSGTGRFSTYYDHEAAPLVQGAWSDALVRPLMQATNNVVVLRLLFVCFAVLAWWVVRRWVLDQWSDVASERRRVRFAGAATASLLIPAWLTTLRPEPLVALIAAIGLAATVRCCLRPGIPPVLVAVGMGVLAMTLHQTGWIVVTAFVPALLYLVPWMRARDRTDRLLSVLTVLLLGACVALILFSFGGDLAILRGAASDFSAPTVGPSYMLGPFDEWNRFVQVISIGSVVRRAALVLPALGLVATIVARRDDAVDAERFAIWGAVAGYLGLALTSSKLEWHYGAVMPFSIVLVAAGFRRICASELRWPALKRRAAALVLVLMGAWAFSTPPAGAAAASTGFGTVIGVWNAFDLSSKKWLDLRHFAFVDVSRPIVWVGGLAVLGAVLVGFATTGHRRLDESRRLLAIALAVTCVLPVGLTWAFLVRDSRAAHGWSFTRQLLRTATDHDVCGLAHDLPVVGSVVPLSQTTGPAGFVAASRDAYDHVTANAVLPAAGIGTWGTRVDAAAPSQPAPASAARATPWYAVAGGTELAFWTTGRATAGNSVDVQFRDVGGRLRTTHVDGTIDASYWSFHRVPDMADGTVALRIILHDNDTKGSLATTTPARVTYTSFAHSISTHDRVWVAPNLYLYAPCSRLPSLANGYMHPFSAIIGQLPTFGTTLAFMSEASIVEIGCTPPGPCAYRVSVADAANLLRR